MFDGWWMCIVVNWIVACGGGFACYLCWMWCLCLPVDYFGFAVLVGFAV